MLCVYLWNKCLAVCQDRNPADGSCSLTVIQAAEKLTCCLESLCANECVQRNKSPAQCSLRVSVSFQPIGQDISCTKNHLTPAASNGTESLIVSTRDSSRVRSPDAALEVMVCWPILLRYWAYKESNLFCYKAGWSPKAVKTLQQLLPANKRLAMTGNTLRWGSVSWCRSRRGQEFIESAGERERDENN